MLTLGSAPRKLRLDDGSDTFNTFNHLVVPEAEDAEAVATESNRTGPVSGDGHRVLATVELDDKFSGD